MKKPPIAVMVVAILLILVGAGGLINDFPHLNSLSANHYETVWIVAVHLLAIVAGGFMLLGHNWARWLAIAWMAFHVAITIGHPVLPLVGHVLFLLLFVWLLFRSDSRAFFGPGTRAA
ncbi:MAG TPA: hypothetical protein VKB38_22830 [Terracidiphilus sp.]|nr:hypothetical protein [Terracidiphilus sp.]